jgi:type IX secretion system substrate protein
MKALQQFGLIAAILILASGQVLAQAPLAPQHLQGDIVQTNIDYGIKLTWSITPNSVPPDAFHIYQADGRTVDLTLFTKIKELAAQPNSAGMYHYLVTGLNTGEYSFYVTASNTHGTSPESNIIHMYIRNIPDHVYFSSQPPTQWDPAKEYVYDADAAASTGGAVKYRALNIPNTATLDETTGEIKYTYVPSSSATVSFSIEAYLVSGPTISAKQQWSVSFKNSNPNQHCASFYGTVRDENGTLVTEGKITGYAIDKRTGSGYGPAIHTTINKHGTYLLRTYTDGKYILQAQGQGFATEFYQDVVDMTLATEFDTQCGDSIEVNFNVQTVTRVHFTTQPPMTGDPNQVYIYDADAVSSDNGVVKFEALSLPQGATLDETTGEIQYTYAPNTSGTVSFAIKAYLVSDPSINEVQQWAVRFVNNHPRECTVFHGTVKDENGNAITAGNIHANQWTASGIYGPVSTGKISTNGTYTIVSHTSGKFKLSANGPLFTTEWYQDAADDMSALEFNTVCGDTIRADFIVAAVPSYTISGMVTEEVSNTPVMANVFAYSSNAHGYKAVTDAHGNYSITVPGGSEYYVRAEPHSNTYFMEFYLNSSSQTGATKVLVDANKTGIDFALGLRPVNQNTISGIIRGEDQTPLACNVYAILMTGNRQGSNVPSTTYKTRSTPNGYFEFKNLAAGTYILNSSHVIHAYVPGYYKENDMAVLLWGDATQIQMTASGANNNIEYVLPLRTGRRGANTLLGNTRGKIGGFAEGAEALENVHVILVDETGKISDYALTDANGDYQMNEASSGTFTLIADLPGYYAYEEVITLDYSSNEPIQYGILLDPMGTTSTDPLEVSPSNINVSVFPNPATSIVNVRISGESQNVGLKLYNHLGQLLRNTYLQVNTTGTAVAIETGKLPTGNYFIQVEAQNSSSTIPLMITK